MCQAVDIYIFKRINHLIRKARLQGLDKISAYDDQQQGLW